MSRSRLSRPEIFSGLSCSSLRLSVDYRPRKTIVKVKNNNINEQKRYQFALLHYRARIDNHIFEDECDVGLRSTQHIIWCRRGEPTPEKEISLVLFGGTVLFFGVLIPG